MLYISFGKPQEADDSDVTEEGVIVRLREGRIVGLTILNASKRVPQVTSKVKAEEFLCGLFSLIVDLRSLSYF